MTENQFQFKLQLNVIVSMNLPSQDVQRGHREEE